MIIRANGAKSGIKEYLEKGQMKGRFFDRDQLDSREILLNGDLGFVDNIINSIANDGDKYFHITLAFKEDYISTDVLNSIANEFREFYFKSYTDEEICFYAEAHLPRIKSYRDRSTGELVERKPHIHVVVPKLNLLTGHILDTTTKHNISYIDAFQEYINCKYGLESPKDNRRIKFNNKSEMISRYKGDDFKGLGKEHKESVFKLIMENNPQSMVDLEKLLLDNGYRVRTRNADSREKTYLNILPKGDTKGINLKEFIFSEEFLQLSSVDKNNYLNHKNEYKNLTKEQRIALIEQNKSIANLYLKAGLNRNIAPLYVSKLQEWNDVIAYQRKYIDRLGGRKSRNEFKNLTDIEKIELLKQKQDQFYKKYGVQEYGIKQSELERIIDIYRGAAFNYLQSAEFNIGEIGTNVERYSGNKIGVVDAEWLRERGEQYARLANLSKKRHIYNSVGREHNSAEGRRHSFIDALTIDYINEKVGGEELKHLLKGFKDAIKADVLLELSQKTHGVLPEKYSISINKSGEDRILCGEHNYSVVDFCLKELSLPWNDTLKMLKVAELMQREVDRERGWNIHDAEYLSTEYTSWLVSFKNAKDNELQTLQADVKNKYELINKKFKDKAAELAYYGDGYHTREKARRILKMERILEKKALYTAKNIELELIKSRYNLDMQQSYRKFLVEKAELDDDRALQELRRLRIDFEEYKKTGSIRYVDRYMEYKLDISYKIDNQGIITYTLKQYSADTQSYIHRDIIKDIGKRIDILDNEVNSVKLALDLAISKYGKYIELFGSADFRKQLVKIAVQSNYKITFKDEFSESYRKELMSKMQKEYSLLEQNSMQFVKQPLEGIHDLLVAEIVKVDSLDYNGKYRELTKIILFDVNTRREYQVNSQQLINLGCYTKLNKGDMLKIDGGVQSSIKVTSHFWKKYVADLSQGVSISSFIDNDKIIIDLPKWRQAKYNEEYFVIEQPGLSKKLEEVGYLAGDLVAIKPSINLDNREISYKFSIIGDSQHKAQVKKNIWREDIKKAQELLSTRNNIKQEGLSKEIFGKVIDFGVGQYKGAQSSFIVMENTNLQVNNNVLTQKEEFCRKHQVSIHNLEKEVVGKIIDFGVGRFNQNDIKSSHSFYLKLLTGYGIRKIWGKDIERMLIDNNINKNDDIYMAKIGHSKSEYGESLTVLYKYECMKLSEAQMGNAKDYITPLYYRYWNPQFKELIDRKLIIRDEFVYIAKVGESTNIEVEHNKKDNFKGKRANLNVVEQVIVESKAPSEIKIDKFGVVPLGHNLNKRAVELLKNHYIENDLQTNI